MVKNVLPAGTPVLSPYLVVADPEALIGFIRTVFGGKETMRIRRADGSIMHAEARIGNSVVMLGGAPEQLPERRAMLHVYVDDVEETFAIARAHGAEEIAQPTASGDGDVRGAVRDPAGNEWWIATRVETLTPAEIEARHRESRRSET